jgi:NAD(P)-dependent dehydrogenase (short-subunit alcohol dehydrogenase family)
MALELSGKRVIITAGGGGIGRQTVKLFSEAGAKIYICDIDEEGLNATIAGHDNVDGMIADVSDPAAFDTLFERADGYLGGLDFMVNNAGTAGPTAPIEEVTLEDWQACLNVNLTSAFLGIQHAIPRIKEAGGGGIVNLSSAAGKFGFALRSPYVSSKWAIVGLTRTTALEVGPLGIRCNCIQPGPVEGDRINRVIRANPYCWNDPLPLLGYRQHHHRPSDQRRWRSGRHGRITLFRFQPFIHREHSSNRIHEGR